MLKVTSFVINTRVLACARLLRNHELLAKLSSGETIANNAIYRKSCLTALYNRARSAERRVDLKRQDRKRHPRNYPCRIDSVHKVKEE